MHPDLSPHLHTSECNDLIALFHKCHQEYPVMKFMGKCSSIDLKMGRCLDKEREQRRQQNYAKSKEIKKSTFKSEWW